MPDLTARQSRCLQGFLERKTAKQIGRELGISHHAVEQHMKAARKKLGARDSAEAARLYFAKPDTTVRPYYRPPEVSMRAETDELHVQPEFAMSQLRDVATDGSGLIQNLSARQTLIAIGLSAVGMITILSLIVAVADGVAQLTQ